ncbi:hypothetical protein AAU57_14040 [Nonlabens sp. YIK11]|uniref:plasmid mobilization protein n=1 Tax=Nonlabens sp. YIK11 TaxID=1453349 RepID=UPI0006DC23B8|nr:hypothetical protein [Nonlabens sp. YIK11]KQC34334.1 hypothetical protein AAU57_14040 [Nonlabens sp. YIK11]
MKSNASRKAVGKTEWIKIRVTSLQKRRYNLMAEKMGYNLSEYIRLLLESKPIPIRKTSEENEFIRSLFLESNRWQSVANMFKKSDPRLSSEVRELVQEFRHKIREYSQNDCKS